MAEQAIFRGSGSASAWLTPEEAAEHLGSICPRTLTRWAREGKVPAVGIGEGKRRLWRFRVRELDEWMEGQRAA